GVDSQRLRTLECIRDAARTAAKSSCAGAHLCHLGVLRIQGYYPNRLSTDSHHHRNSECRCISKLRTRYLPAADRSRWRKARETLERRPQSQFLERRPHEKGDRLLFIVSLQFMARRAGETRGKFEGQTHGMLPFDERTGKVPDEKPWETATAVHPIEAEKRQAVIRSSFDRPKPAASTTESAMSPLSGDAAGTGHGWWCGHNELRIYGGVHPSGSVQQ